MSGEEEPPKPQHNDDQPGNSSATQGLLNNFSTMSIRDFGKPKTYVHGDNFHVFCQRFVQYVTINNITDFLDLRFLSLVDNRTHSKLLEAKISAEDKLCPQKLVEAYTAAMNLGFTDCDVMTELFAIEQKPGEKIEDLIYRMNLVTQKSTGLTDVVLEKSKIGALTKAVTDPSIKTELRKNMDGNWKDAVKIAQILDTPRKSVDQVVNFISNTRDSVQDGQDRSRDRNYSGERSRDRSQDRDRSRDRNSNRGGSYQAKRKLVTFLECYICGKGHMARDCYKRYRGKSRDQSRSNSSDRYYRGRSSSREENRSNSRDQYRNRSNSRDRYRERSSQVESDHEQPTNSHDHSGSEVEDNHTLNC